MKQIESLELRELHSGIVDITFPDGGILIKGDDANNSIVIQYRRSPGTRATIYGRSHTLLRFNGVIQEGTSVLTRSMGKTLTIDLIGGDDVLYLDYKTNAGAGFGKTSLTLGDGNDVLAIGSRFDSLSIDAGNGDDSIVFDSPVLVSGNCAIQTGAGGDSLTMYGAQISGKLWLADSSGASVFRIDDTYVRRSTVIQTSASYDYIGATNCIFRGSFTCRSRLSGDLIDLRQAQLLSTTDIGYDKYNGTGGNVRYE